MDMDQKSSPLPAKLWEYIFDHLTAFQLLRARAVCRQWRDVVTGSPNLMGRFCGVLSGRETMDQRYRPAIALPVDCLQLTRFTIVGTGSWWAGYGPGVTSLFLRGCSITVAVLYDVLKQTPNLDWLHLDDVTLSGSAKPDFRLEKLTNFCMDNPNNVKIPAGFLDNLAGVFFGLKILRLLHRVVNTKEIVGSVIKIIRANQETLESLELLNGDYLAVLCGMEKLRLKSLSCAIDFGSEQWDVLCRRQPQIEKLLISVENCEMLCLIGRRLPKLQELPLDIFRCTIMRADFLNEMPNLEKIDFNGHHNGFDFRSAASPKLTMFHMMNATAKKLFQFLLKSPNLVEINLHDCVLIGDPEQPGRFQNLKALILSKCQLPPNLMMALFCQNPQLERVQLRFMANLTDQMFLTICKQLPRLQKLALVECEQITEAAGDHIIRHCSALEKLEINGVTLSEEVLAVLRERHVRVQRWLWPYPTAPDCANAY